MARNCANHQQNHFNSRNRDGFNYPHREQNNNERKRNDIHQDIPVQKEESSTLRLPKNPVTSKVYNSSELKNKKPFAFIARRVV